MSNENLFTVLTSNNMRTRYLAFHRTYDSELFFCALYYYTLCTLYNCVQYLQELGQCNIAQVLLG